MTRLEFGVTINQIRAAIGKELPADALEVYFDCLGDLDNGVFKLAAKRVLMEHRWATFPSIAELREAAALTVRGEVSGLPAAKAWELAWGAVKCIDLDIDGSVQRAMRDLHPLVADTMRAMGIASLVGGDDPVPVVRAQFIAAYEQLAARAKREALLPADTRKAIEEAGNRREIAAPVRLAIDGIGKDVA